MLLAAGVGEVELVAHGDSTEQSATDLQPQAQVRRCRRDRLGRGQPDIGTNLTAPLTLLCVHHLNDPGRKGLQSAAARTFLEHVEAGVPVIVSPALDIDNPALDRLTNDHQPPLRGRSSGSTPPALWR